MGKSHGGETADLICGRAVERGCVYASDRRAERYEPDRGITDSLPGVCSLGDCRMVDLTAGIVGAGTVWMCIDVCSDRAGADTDAGKVGVTNKVVSKWETGKSKPTTNVEYQRCQMKLQIEKEKIFEQAARTMASDKVLIVCDRGTLDNKAYMNEVEFAETIRYIGSHEVELRDNYDAVFHLVTVAKGAEEFYTTANNSARTETVEEAATLDDKLISAWTGHPHLRVIDNTSTFEDKMKKLVAEIASFLGEPEPYEIERKYLIEYPDIKWLETNPSCQRIEIIQT